MQPIRYPEKTTANTINIPNSPISESERCLQKKKRKKKRSPVYPQASPPSCTKKRRIFYVVKIYQMIVLVPPRETSGLPWAPFKPCIWSRPQHHVRWLRHLSAYPSCQPLQLLRRFLGLSSPLSYPRHPSSPFYSSFLCTARRRGLGIHGASFLFPFLFLKTALRFTDGRIGNVNCICCSSFLIRLL